MSTDGIDAKKLKEAIEHARRDLDSYEPMLRAKSGMLIAAAEAHLATLPQHFERWLVVSPGCEFGPYVDKRDADAMDRRYPGSVVIRLTGTAVLPKG